MKRNIFLLILSLIWLESAATANKKEVYLTITNSQSNLTDITQIYLGEGLSTKYVPNEDVQETFDSTSTMPLIYSFTSDNVACYSNGYGNFAQSVAIALGVKIYDSGTFIISALQIINFDATSTILLEDRLQGTFTDLRQGNDTFQTNGSCMVNNRFYLHLIYPPVLQTTAADCSNNNGSITITEDNSISWNSILLFNGNNTLLQTLNNVVGNYTFGGLTGGNYFVAFIYKNNTAVKTVSINNHQVWASISVEGGLVTIVDLPVQFFSSAVNATNFDWYFGDNSIVTGVENPEYTYFEPGNFTISLIASNDYGCVDTATQAMYVQNVTGITNVEENKISVIVQQKVITINSTDYRLAGYTYEIYNLSGQLLMENPVNAANTVVSMNNQPAGIYVMNFKNQDANFTKKIFIE